MSERAQATSLRLRLFGEPAILLRDGRVVALERRAAAVLALAALEPEISRLRVAAMLWPDSSDPRRNLRQQLLRFRQLFGQSLVAGESVVTLAGIELEQPEVEPPPAADLLAGLRFGDCEQFDAWLQAQRQARRDRTSRTLDAALTLAEAAQRYGDAIALAEKMLVNVPEAEAHHRTLIRLHYLNHDTARARAAFAALRRMLEHEFGARPSAETLALMRLVDQPAAPALAPARVWATALQRPPRMVGRARELQLLRQSLADRRALLLRGEAGMGKSRLLAEALHDPSGQIVIKAQAGDAGVPYATLARLLRRLLEKQRLQPEPGALARLLPELGPVSANPSMTLPAEGERLVLQSAVERLIADARLQAVAVDDLHFADDASLEMLTALANAEALSHMAWVFTQRPGEGSAAASALRDVLEEVQRLEVTDLAPLDAARLVELVQSLDLADFDVRGVGERLLRHTGGNPLFALETLKQMLVPGAPGTFLPQPASVSALIDRRLRQLSEGAMAMARVAAVAGPDFDPALAERVLGRRAIELADAWAELESAQVLRDSDFAHDLVRDAVLRSIPAPIAMHLHGELARWLAGRNDEPARIAMHWQAAGDAERAADAWMDAGRTAEQRLRSRDAVRCFEQAAELYEQQGLAEARFRARRGAVNSASLLDIKIEEYELLVDRFLAAGSDDGMRAEALVYRLRLLEMRGDFAAQIPLAQEVISLARLAGRKDLEGTAMGGLAGAHTYLSDLEQAGREYARVSEIGAEIGDAEMEGFGHSSRGTVLIRRGLLQEAIHALETARPIFERGQLWFRLAMVEQQLAVLLLARGDPTRALAGLERAASLLDKLDDGGELAAHVRIAKVMGLRQCGRLADAVAEVAASLPILDALGTWLVDRLRLEEAQLFIDLGRADLANRSLAQARTPQRLPASEVQRGRYVELCLLGLTRTAARQLQPSADMECSEPQRRCQLLRALAALRRGAERAKLLGELLRLSVEFDLPAERRAARAAMAEHLLEEDQVQAAAELARVAMEDKAVVCAGYPPQVWAVAVEVFTAHGDTVTAHQALAAALDWIEAAVVDLESPYRLPFLQRNPVNAALLAAAQKTPQFAARVAKITA